MSDKFAVLWDVDGTLADSEPLHSWTMLKVLKKYGAHLDDIDNYIGINAAEVYKHLKKSFPAIPNYEGFDQERNELFFKNIDQVTAFTESVAACKRYAKEGRKQAAVSNSSELLVEATLRIVGIRDVLSCVITCDGLGEPKPHPDPYLRALKLLDVKSENAICVEDSIVGTTSAVAAGLFVVGLPENDKPIGANVHYSKMPDLSPEQIISENV